MGGHNNRELLWDYFKTWFVTYLVFVGFACVGMVCFLLVRYEVFETSAHNAQEYANHEFTLEVSATGETVFTAVEGVSEELAQELLGAVYPSPDEAVYASEHDGFVPEGAAWAHAVNLCTHRDGVVSNDTGSSRHLTYFVKHDNGRHYTKTYHQHLTRNGWITDDVYRWNVTRSWCGCN